MSNRNFTFEALGLVENGDDDLLSNITILAARLLNAPISLVNVIQKHRDRQYASAAFGIALHSEADRQLPIDQSVCRFVLEQDDVLSIPDLLEDARTMNMQSILDLNVRAYLGAPIHDVRGKPIGALCCLKNEPTDWKYVEIDSLKRLAFEIDDIIRTRARALELVATNSKLNKLLAARSSFSSHLSHEVRTPLTGLIGAIGLLKRMQLGGQAGDLIDVMSRSSTRLMKLVNDILDFAKLDAGKLQLESVPCDIGQVVRDVVTSQRVLAEEKGCEVWIDDQLDGEQFYTDSRALTSILENLFGNAVKFTEVGRAGIILRKGQYSLIEILVVDTGIGIAPEAQPTIFDEFQQASPRIAREYGGTGLGMAIVKRLVEALHGDTQVTSELNKGTTITISLPMVPSASPATP